MRLTPLKQPKPLKPLAELELCEKCAERTGIEAGELEIVDAERCIYCCGLLSKIEELRDRILGDLKEYEFETFLVGTRLEGSIKAFEEYLQDSYGLEAERSIRYEFNRELSLKLQEAGKIPDFDRPDVTILFNAEKREFEYRIRPVYIYGRYIKRVRNISQTRWLCSKCKGKGCEECNFQGKRYYTSVEELIANPCVEIFKAEKAILHGAGREDVDARMLGNGRPFVLEIVNPKLRRIDLGELERLINEKSSPKVVVKDLEMSDEKTLKFIKGAAFRKKYRAKVRFERQVEEEKLGEAIAQLSNRVIQQRTPLRVLHRRADLVRKRRTHKIEVLLCKNDLAVLEIEADSGLYIKELVSGDEGRTVPSLSELLGVRAWVEKLDVVGVYDKNNYG
ncbi:MAG: tRNA pseudouridine(54/55) synthase Pus10 [Archaeoglobus sp.]|nr:tRNA pseudouridine(54/55) synthase Pus10 [Archaeoglobus sp.]